MKITTLLFLLIFKVAICQVTANYSRNEVSEYIEKVKSEYNLPGLVVAIINENGIEYLENFGNVSKDGRFLIGSNSKGFTALLTLKLQEQGLLNINDPVVKYLDWFEYANKQVSDKITLKDLLHHTSGLSIEAGQYFPDKNEDNVQAMFAEKLKNITVDENSINDFRYSNINYILLGYVIENVTDQDYSSILELNITEPLGMDHTSTTMNDDLVQGYQYFMFYPIIPVTLNYHQDDAPAAYINSNAIDLSKYLRALMNSYNGQANSAINKKLTAELFNSNKFNNSRYALGWYAANNNGNEIFAHDGAIEGFQSSMVIVPKIGKSLIVLTNCFGAAIHPPNEISKGLLNILSDKKPKIQSKILFYCVGSLPILVFVLIIILMLALKKWVKAQRPVWITRKIVPNLLLLFGVILGLSWIILVPAYFEANLRNALDFDISGGLSLIFLSVTTIALSFIIYFNQNNEILPNN